MPDEDKGMELALIKAKGKIDDVLGKLKERRKLTTAKRKKPAKKR
jgi:hypothetical protein